MNDDLAKLEQVLRERAAEVPHVQEAPSKMLARARRRVVRNGLTTVVAAGLIVAAASGGLATLGALRGPKGTTPAVAPTVHSPAPAPSTPSCTAADLSAKSAVGGAAGSVVGSVDLTNVGTRTCTLTGSGDLRIFSSSGRPVTDRTAHVGPQFKVDGASPPPGWPVVRLDPGSIAAIRVAWSNPCPQLTTPTRWVVYLNGGGGMLDVEGSEAISPPPCNGPGEPSTLQVGPFEPGTK